MFYVAVVCPPSDVPLLDGYELTSEERFLLAGRLVGIPITVQHANVAQHLSTIPKGTALLPALMQTKLDSCGLVICAWVAPNGCLMAAFSVHSHCTSVNQLIKMNHLAFVSLTHVVQTCEPVELSLCSNPARTGTKIVLATNSLEDIYRYKARHELADITTSSIMNAESATPLTPLQVALNSLSSDERTLVEARMSTMMEAVDKARADQTAATAKFDEMMKTSKVDEKLLEQHLNYLYSFLSEEDKKLYCVGNIGADKSDPTFDALKSAPPGVVHTMSNLIKCASAKMAASTQVNRQQRNATSANMSSAVQNKRKADTSAQELQEAPEVVAVEDGTTVLERALAAQFC